MENNFEKHVRQTMNQPPDLPFEEKLWKGMESRLDKGENNNRVGVIPWWPFALLSVLSSLAAIYFYGQTKTPTNGPVSLNQKIIIIDTIVQKQLTVVYDTIYNKVLVNQFVNQSQASTSELGNSFLEAPYFRQLFQKSQLKNPVAYQFDLAKLSRSIGEKAQSGLMLGASNTMNKTNSMAPTEIFNIQNLQQIPYLSISALSSSPSILSNIDYDVEAIKTNNFHMLQLMPSAFSLSANGGSFLDLSFWGSPNKLMMGIKGQVHYGDQFGLVIGANFLRNGFTEDIEPDDLVNYPAVQGNDPSDPVKEVYGNFDYLQIPIGFQYTFQNRSKWRPIIGGGIISQTALKSQLRFEFNGLQEEYYSDLNDLIEKGFQINTFWANVGTLYQLKSKWNLEAQLFSQYQFNGSNQFSYEKIRLLGLQLGLAYTF